ncbi:hypothetical protein QVD17_08236 [Tagetes erecta]|uniref:MBD domain-containing protein n=1 Tax=Tagetes erecta TaxID=13708 RepID=A0AAD8KXV2_TARER|nr:hypothetical protein QVD17_08236 [Tagetes erecta]
MSPVKSPVQFTAQDKIVVEKNDEEELLPGWTKEVKIRKTGSATKVDRYYTDPVTGYIFRSLRDVQRYLKTGELGRLAKKPKMKETEEPSAVKEHVSESETVRHKRAPTDDSELVAHSSKRLAGVNIDAVPSLPSPSLSQPKTRRVTRLAGVKVDAPSPSQSLTEPKTRQATRLAGVAVDAPPPSLLEPKTRQAARLAEVAVTASSPLKPEPKTRQATRLAVNESLSSTSPAPPKTRQAARQAGIKIDSPPSLSPDSKAYQAKPLTGTESGPSPPSQLEPRTRQAKRVSGIRDNASPPHPKTRRATHQAGIKVNSPPPSPPDTRTSRQATKTKLLNSATPKANVKKTEEKSITIRSLSQENIEKPVLHNKLPAVTPKEHKKQSETRATISLPAAHQALPTVVPPVNLEKQELPVINPTVSHPTDMKADSSINFSMNDLWTDPCIEFAVKTLTGATPFPDLNKVENFTTTPLQVPLEELWTDPCIEFAVKTLTGAIPVREDDYFQHRPASSTNSQGLHHFSSPDSGTNLCQTNVSSKHYETGHKNTQQDAVFPTLGNGGFQKSGTFVNGQCSRPRFFQ